MFVVILRYPEPDTTPAHRAGHTAWIGRHSDAGRFLYTGPMIPRVGGIIVADVASREELEAMLRDDPYGKAGATYEILEFAVLGGSLSTAAAGSRSED
jgi:uncharacterized protein YciI